MNWEHGCNGEIQRLEESARREKHWKRWGPYLAERQWGTVREDYSQDGSTWDYFTHDHARSRAYRWGEDGLLGLCDRQGRLCLALALWNGCDPFLKERLFGLSNAEGNHGEDVKECYFYLDSTPTHSYMKALYKYPQAEFPYTQLVEENRCRSPKDPEFELADTGIFDENRYFDVFVEYAKASPNDILLRLNIVNRGSDPAMLDVLPTLWFKNTWSWGCTDDEACAKPQIERAKEGGLIASHATLGKFRLQAEPLPGKDTPTLLFTENETNTARLFGTQNNSPYVKDAFHAYIVNGNIEAINLAEIGTKAAIHYHLELSPGQTATLRLRLFAEEETVKAAFGQDFEEIFEQRIHEANEFYAGIYGTIPLDKHGVLRQAYAGLLWSKQFYHYGLMDWLTGDPIQPRLESKVSLNHEWGHLYNRDVISVPDKWEYPWYATWDLAFHMIPMATLDPEFAKEQLILFLREWYMHPNGALPAYEFSFSDTNPPVHAWACWRVYQLTAAEGKGDRIFLARAFHKLLLNFTWWVNRKDMEGNNIFEGGFLGLDNIGVFNRSHTLPTGGRLEQADATAWMAFYCSVMLSMALELAWEDPTYKDVASKFFEHFIVISDAINTLDGTGLWDEEDGFYYDHLRSYNERASGRKPIPLKVRSLVGLIPLCAVEVLEQDVAERLGGFSKRVRWLLENREDLAQHISYKKQDGTNGRLLLTIPTRERLERIVRYLLDENEFLSPYGIRSLSRIHKDNPYSFWVNDEEYRVEYVPGESDTNQFGGNSNWRGPIWFPINYLLIEALERYHNFYGDTFQVECPTGSGQMMTLREVSQEISWRLVRLFMPDETGRCPWQGDEWRYAQDPHWRELTLFHEYFHGDTGRGVGASHQTGWTALVTVLLQKLFH